MARDDVERVNNSGALMDNFMPVRIGPMVYRPGTEYRGAAKPAASHFLMPFVDDGTTPTFIEFSQSSAIPSLETVRFWVNGELTTVTATADTITNGAFTSDLTGWTDDSVGAGETLHSAGGTGRALINGGPSDLDWGRLYQTLTTTAGERTLRIDISEGPAVVQLGTGGKQTSDIFQGRLGFGVHFLTFTADGTDVTVTLSQDKGWVTGIDNVGYVSAGTMELSANMVTDNTGNGLTLDTLRYTQVNDVLFITDNAYEQEGGSWPFWIIKRYGDKSWSFELPEVTDGPFGFINDTSTTLKPSAVNGNATLTASNSFFTAQSITNNYQLLHGSTYGVCQVTSVVSETVANVRILRDFGGTTAVADWWQGLFGYFLPSPTAAEIYEGRLWLAGGSRLYGSVSDQYTSFDELLEGNSAAIVKTIGFGPVQNIAWLLGGDVLMAGLSSEEVQVTSNGDFDSINPFNANVRRGTNKGSGFIRPAIVDQVIYFVNRSLLKVFALTGLKGESIEAQDSTLIHPTILSPGVKKMVYSSEPEPRMYCLLTDGSLRVLLFDKGEQVQAWSRITLGGGGTVEDIAAVPTGDEDEVYLVVERDGTRHIERLAKFTESTGGSDSRHYDSHVYAASPGATFSGLDHLEGLTVYIWADGVEKGTAVVASGAITLPASSYGDVVVGLRHTATWKSNRLGRYIEESVLNYRKRVVQIGLIMRSVALRNFRYGPDDNNLQNMPDVDKGRPRGPTVEPEPSVVGSYTGAAVVDMVVQGDFAYLATPDFKPSISGYDKQFAAYDGGKIYIAGGNRDNPASPGTGTTSDQVVSYEVATGAVAVLTPLTQPISSHAVAAADGVLYVYNETHFQAYDIATQTNLVVAQPSAYRRSSGMAVYNGILWIYGGLNTAVGTSTYFARYDIVADSWTYPTYGGTIEAKESHGMCAPQAGAGAGKLYIFGGRLAGLNNVGSDKLYEYDIGTNTMTQLTGTGFPKAEAPLVSGDDDFLYLTMGHQPLGGLTDPTIRRYSISGDSWSTLDTLTDEGGVDPYSRNGHGSVYDPVNDRVYVYGGKAAAALGIDLGGEFTGYDPSLWHWDVAASGWVEDESALLGTGGALQILNISDPENIQLHASADVSDGSGNIGATGIEIGFPYAYLIYEQLEGSTYRGFAVFDITDAASPVQLSATPAVGPLAPNGSRGIQIIEGHALVMNAEGAGTISAFVLGDGTAPTIVDTLNLTIAGTAPEPINMVQLGSYTYFAWEALIYTIDVSDPNNMVEYTEPLPTLTAADLVHRDGKFLYVVDSTNGALAITLVDVNVLNPGTLSTLEDARLVGAVDLISFAPWIYILTDSKMHVIDARDPRNPVYYAEYEGPTGLTSIESTNPNQLYVGGRDGGGIFYLADQRSWQYVDYDEMSFEFNGTYDTDSRITLQATGPATVLALTYEVEDIDDKTNGSDGPAST